MSNSLHNLEGINFPGLALEKYKNLHAGETIIVFGCGQSAAHVKLPEKYITIGVNDIGRLFEPNYLVVLNPKSQFPRDRFQHIENTQAIAVFSQLNLPVKYSSLVKLTLGKKGETQVDENGRVPFTRNSPYVAVCLAAYMGASRIGLIGVDFTDHHFFAHTGRHSLCKQLQSIDEEYYKLAQSLGSRGIELSNLSTISQLKKLPRKSLTELVSVKSSVGNLEEKSSSAKIIDIAVGKSEKLNIVHLSTTNCAGAFWNLNAMLRQYAGINSRVITASNRTNGRLYPKDVLLSERVQVRRLLEQADVIHFHNWLDKSSRQLAPWRSIIRDKPAVLQFHSEHAVLQRNFGKTDLRTRQDLSTIVVAQKQARDYPHAIPVPNALDLYNSKFVLASPHNLGKLKVVYTPTDLKTYQNNQHTCRGKGYGETRKILTDLKSAGVIDVNIESSVPWERLVKLRSTADVLIDECVTGGYHLTSLEGLAQGMATIAHLDQQTIELLCRITGSTPSALPWVNCQMKDLAEVLIELANNPQWLAEIKVRSRAWMEKFWQPTQVLSHYLAVYSSCLGRSIVLPDQSESKNSKKKDTQSIAKGEISMVKQITAKKSSNTKVRKAACSKSKPANDNSVKKTGDAIKNIRYQIVGSAHPKRSEDFPQSIKLSKKLLSQKGAYKGKACHILGNGPSVNELDLSLLDERLIIGVNAATLLKSEIGRSADFYCVTDRRFLEQTETAELARKKGQSTRVFAGYCDGLIPGNDINYVKICGGDGFSTNIEDGFYHCCSVVLFAAQLGVWLGATEIYLHGCEYDYAKGRFYSQPHPAPHDTHIYPRIEKSTALLADYLRKNGGCLYVVGHSRLLGDFGGTAVAGIESIAIDKLVRKIS